MKNYGLWLIKIDRIAAWTLLFSIFLYFISGYGMTKGVIDREIATFLHQNALPLITIFAFSIHVFSGIRISFMRWRIWNRLTKTILIIIFLIVYLLFLYFQFFYKPLIKTANNYSTEASNQNGNQQIQKIFTIPELTKYNGQNGSPAYVAVDGIVYDLSDVFKNGVHSGHTAGQDLTKDFFIKHAKSQITKYPIAGLLE